MKTKSTILILLSFLALAVIAWLPQSLHLGSAMTDTWDGCLNAWILNWNFHQFDTGFPNGLTGYFNGNIMYPHEKTLAFSEHLLGVALVFWPIKSLFSIQNPIVMFNLIQIFSYALMGFAVFLFTRQLGFHPAIAWMAGVMVGFSPFRMIQHGHFQLLSFYWLPLTLWTMTGWLQTGKKRWLPFMAIAHLLQILSSYYLAIFHCMTITLFLLATTVKPLVSGSRQRIFPIVIILCLATLPIIPVSLPYFELDETLDLAASDEFMRNLSATPGDYLSPEPMGAVYQYLVHLCSSAMTPCHADTEHQVFPGGILLAIAVISPIFLWLRKRRNPTISHNTSQPVPIIPMILFATFSGTIALVLSLGPGAAPGIALPFKWLSIWLPGFQVIRVPTRFSVLVQFSLVLLAAIALQTLVKSSGKRAFSAIILGILFFLETGIWPAPSTPFPAQANPPQPYTHLAENPNDGPVVELPLEHRKYKEMLNACYHWRPIINGISGYQPPGRLMIEQTLQTFPYDRSLNLLLGLGVQDLVVYDELPEWSRDGFTSRGFNLKPLLEFEKGVIFRLDTTTSTPRKPYILCDLPTIVLENQQHVGRVHVFNPSSWDMMALETGYQLHLTFKSTAFSSNESLPIPDDIHIEGNVPPIFLGGHIWTCEFWLPEFPPNTQLNYDLTFEKTGIITWQKNVQGEISSISAFQSEPSAKITPDAIMVGCREPVIYDGNPVDIQAYIKNETRLLWNKSTELIINDENPVFIWDSIALYPGQELPSAIPAKIVSVSDSAKINENDSRHVAINPTGAVMPGMTAFCSITIESPPGPGAYLLTGPNTQPIPLVFLGPERSIPWYTDIFVQSNQHNQQYLIDNDLSTAWSSTRPVRPGTSLHLHFRYPRRIQGVRLYCQRANETNHAVPSDRASLPQNPSILFSDHAQEWERVMPDTRWNSELQALDIWFPPREVFHMAIHATGTHDQVWTVGELKLL